MAVTVHGSTKFVYLPDYKEKASWIHLFVFHRVHRGFHSCFCFCFYWRLKLLTSRITRILIVQVRTFTPPNSDFIAFHRLIAFNIKYLSVFRVQQLAQINSMETFTSLREASPCPSARVTSHILWPHQIDPSSFTPSCALLIQQCLQPS